MNLRKILTCLVNIIIGIVVCFIGFSYLEGFLILQIVFGLFNVWLWLEHYTPSILTGTSIYKWFVQRYYPGHNIESWEDELKPKDLFEHYCVFCRKYTNDWWE